MKVKILEGLMAANTTYNPGDIVDIHESLAKSWASIGICEIIEAKKKDRATGPSR